MKVVISDYDADQHGYQDDCDYVIEHNEESESLAVQMGEMMGYDTHMIYPCLGNYQQSLFLCHA